MARESPNPLRWNELKTRYTAPGQACVTHPALSLCSPTASPILGPKQRGQGSGGQQNLWQERPGALHGYVEQSPDPTCTTVMDKKYTQTR